MRGSSLGCQPKGFAIMDEGIGLRYGAVAYTRELTELEVSDYELEYLGNFDYSVFLTGGYRK
jgi:hypothetical protein